MRWFEEQIKTRKDRDEAQFSQAAADLRSAVTRKWWAFYQDDSARTKGALDKILSYYGLTAREIPPSVKSLNDKVDYVCRPHGIPHRAVTLEPGWYKNAIGPMLGTTKEGESVPLTPGQFGGYFFTHPQTGAQVRVNKRTQDLLSENAISFYRPFPQKEMDRQALTHYVLLSLSPISLLYVALSILGATLLGLLMPKITKLLFSTVIDEGNIRLLLALAVLAATTTVAALLLQTIQSLLMGRITTEIETSVEAATMSRLLSLPAEFFRDYSAGELSERARYIKNLCSAIASAVLSTGLTSVFSLLFIRQVFRYAKPLVMPSLVITGITVLFMLITVSVNVRASRKQMELQTKHQGMTYALISGVQKLRLSGSEQRAFSRWMKLFAEWARQTYACPLLLVLSDTISLLISLTGTGVLYFLAVQHSVSVSDYYAFTTAYGMMSAAFLSLVSVAQVVGNVRPVWDLSKPILQALPKTGEGLPTVSTLSGGVELNNVRFRYRESSPYVLDDLSLKIRPGQYVAVVGKTGCGKSTLVRLLLGFERPQTGAIYYDGQDLSFLDLRSVRRNIGCVTQNGKLFHGSIFSNIVISAPWLTLEDAWRAAELADIADDIRAMPMGMHTVISEGTGGISGGQKQRLMIARAVAPNPKLLILDEATAALDNITQKKVSQALDALKCTRIVIAHRLSTIRQCDRIIVLDGGKIIEDGTYDELIARGGFFAELVERQQLVKS